MYKTITGLMCKIVLHVVVMRPGVELRIGTDNAGVKDAIAHHLHILVYVAVEHAPQPFFGREQQIVEGTAVLYQHIRIHPNRVHG